MLAAMRDRKSRFKAQIACENAREDIADHFVGTNKMVEVGSGATRKIADIMLTRYACYLIAQNGDPKKDSIAFAQTYFAVQTRKQELIEERLKLMERFQAREKLEATETELSRLIYERGVDNSGFARIRSKGDSALFGGRTTKEMKQKMGVPENRPLADFLPTLTIKAKDFAAEITNFNVKRDDLTGETDGEIVFDALRYRQLLPSPPTGGGLRRIPSTAESGSDASCARRSPRRSGSRRA